jgi:putative transposase
MHIVQRGVNRAAVFLGNQDRGYYLTLLRDALGNEEVALHAYVLMGNHVHLLVSCEHHGRISRAMRQANQRYVQAFNRLHGRTGTLWEERFKSSLVDSEHYLLTVMRYIELNPVRAAMVAHPWEHAWSSVHGHLARRADAGLTMRAEYLALGRSAEERAAAWRTRLLAPLGQETVKWIRTRVASQCALGDQRFVAMIEHTLNVPAGHRARGRPRKDR